MKIIRKVIFIILLSISMVKITNAKGSVSISANSNYVTTGGTVTFYIKVNNAAAWNLKGYGIGATTGCSLGDGGVGDSGNGENVSKNIESVTCKATSVGQVGFVVEGDVSSVNGSNIEKTSINTSKSVTVQAPREKDTNNYLKSLNVLDYEISPSFNKETLEYTVNVPSTIKTITIEASKESNYATLSGSGEYEINEGINTFEINVTSETGIDRVYKVIVNVADENPLEITIQNNKYTIIKNKKNLEAPKTYEASTVKIKDFDIPAFYSSKTKLTLIGVKDSKGATYFAIYKENEPNYELYNENKSTQLLLYIKNIKEEKERFKKENIVINNISYDALVFDDDPSIILVYAMDIENGDDNFYLYNKEEGTFTKYNESLLKNEKLETEIVKYKNTITYFIIALGFLLFIILLLLLRKPKKKKEKKSALKIEKLEINKEENKSFSKKDEKSNLKENKKYKKEDALKQVSDAATIIEEYEKTISLNKKDLQKKQKELDNEETMYDIFESDKKKKK